MPLIMSPSIYADNFDRERLEQEKNKYGRFPSPVVTQYTNPDKKHSIEPAYGLYSRPINEIV